MSSPLPGQLELPLGADRGLLTEEEAARFWEKVEKSGASDGCWLWTGARFPNGYGQMFLSGRGRRKTFSTHRLSWVLHRGPIPAGMEVCHRCDTPPCVNPAHLFLGTPADNASDMVAKGRQMRGDGHYLRQRPEVAALMRGNTGRNPLTKLDDRTVRAIRRRYAAGGVSLQKLADEVGVKLQTVHKIITRRTWAWLSDDEEPPPGRDPVEEGERLRDEAIDRVGGGAPAVALVEAVELVRRIAERRRTLVADDVWLALEALWDEGALSFPEPRTMGAVFKLAEKEGYVAPTEEHRLSRRPVCHRRPIRVWASRIFRGREAVAA